MTTLPWDIIGHRKALHQLEQDFEDGNLAHAYVIAGPGQIGKFTVMKRLAAILQCEQNFCRHCSTCLALAKGYHADTLELLDDGESIKIETMRELLTKVALSAQSSYKIVLIKNIERMTTESANALLKTLEDPPPKVKFLLTTSNVASVLSTILSRVRLLKFQTVGDDEILAFLEQRYPHYAAQDLKSALAFALGKPGKALTLLQNSELFREYQNLYDEIGLLLERPDRIERFRFVEQLTKDEGQVEPFLILFVALLRQKLWDASQHHDSEGLRHWIEIFHFYQRLQEMMKRNVHQRLLLENLMLLL